MAKPFNLETFSPQQHVKIKLLEESKKLEKCENLFVKGGRVTRSRNPGPIKYNSILKND